MAQDEKPIFPLTASQRRLKALVIALGVLIALAFGALVVGFIVKLGHGKHQQALPANTPFQSSLKLDPGESVVSAHLKGHRLLVHIKGPNGDEIVILDAATGREVGRVQAKPQP